MQASFFVLALGWITASLPAQQRRPLRGIVEQADGSAWAGAHVILEATILPRAAAAPAVVDKLQTTTDSHGRFRVAALIGRSYDAWAHGPIGEDGSYRATTVQTARTSERARLRAMTRVSTLRNATLARRELGAARLLIRRAGKRGTYVPADRQAGRFTLPPLPGTRCVLEAVDAHGVRIAMATPTLQGATNIELDAPIATVLAVRVRSDGKPAVGATIHEQLGLGVAPIARTDKNGWARVPYRRRLPPTGLVGWGITVRAERNASQLHTLLVGRPGGKKIPGGTRIDPKRRVEDVIQNDTPDIAITLDAAQRVRGRLLLGGRPVGQARVRLVQAIPSEPHPVAEPALYSTRHAVPARPDGSFSFDSVRRDAGFRIDVHFGEAVALAVGRPSIVGALTRPSRSGNGRGIDLGDIDLDKLPHVRIEVRLEDGTPARFARVVVARGRLVEVLESDRLGRCRVYASEGSEISVLAFAEGRIGQAKWRVGSSDKANVVLELEAPVVVRGSVRDDLGEPIANARVSLDLVAPSSASLLDRVPTMFTRTKRDGSFAMPAPAGQLVRVGGLVRQNGWPRISASHELRLDRDPPSVDLVIAK